MGKKTIKHTSEIEILDSMLQMDPLHRKAMKEAIAMLDKAYAPYSKFKVGAAAVSATGNIYGGCNQENASYPLCICAERVALYNAGVYEHDIPVTAIAIVCKSPDKLIEKPVSPCGACRQVISEFEGRHGQQITIYLKGDTDEIYLLRGAESVLPFLFDSSYL